jgi:hypothetical protein
MLWLNQQELIGIVKHIVAKQLSTLNGIKRYIGIGDHRGIYSGPMQVRRIRTPLAVTPLAQNPTAILKMLAQSLPAATHFYLNYVPLQQGT